VTDRAKFSFPLVLVIVAILTITAHRVFPERPSALLDAIVHSLHGPGFAAITVLIYLVVDKNGSAIRPYFVTGCVAMAIGLISEIAQIPGSRDAQVTDLVVDGIGIVGALAAIAFLDKRILARMQIGFRPFVALVATLAFIVTFVPTIWFANAFVMQRRAMPSLLSFEHRWELATYDQAEGRHPTLIPKPEAWPGSTPTVAYTREIGRWGTLIRLKPFPDWRGYSILTFVAQSMSDSDFELDVDLINMRAKGEKKSPRFETSVSISASPKRYVLPLHELRSKKEDKLLDKQFVKSLTFSASYPGQGAAMLIDDIRLE